jgi:hypothetical protein
MRPRAWLGGVVLVSLGSVLACDALLGLSDETVIADASADAAGDSSVPHGDGGGDAPAIDAPASDAPSEGANDGSLVPEACVVDDDADYDPSTTCVGALVAADAGADAAPSAVLYVSAAASNGDGGMSSPFTTIAQALAVAPAGAEIRICQGTYNENDLVVSQQVVLRGAYVCQAWTRPPDYGPPNYTGTDNTVVLNSALSTNPAVTISADVIIDGLNIQAPSMTQGAPALAITGGAPTIANSEITGGDRFADEDGGAAFGSVGLVVNGPSATPEISGCTIAAGSGVGTTSSSVGLMLAGSTQTYVHDNVINAGPASDNAGSNEAAGVYVGGTANVRLERNQIKAVGTTAVFTYGITTDGQSSVVALQKNSFVANAQIGTAIAVNAASGSFTIVGNRIAANSAIGVNAIQASGVGSVTALTDNMIYASNENTGPVTAVTLPPGPDIAVAYNTIVAVGGGQGWDLAMQSGGTLTDNLFVSDTTITGIQVACANSGVVPMLEIVDNAFLGVAGVANVPVTGDSGCALANLTTISSLEGVAWSQAKYNALVVDPTTGCGDASASSCIVVPSALANPAGALFADYENGNELSDCPPGWHLDTSLPCSVRAGGVPVTGVTQDILGKTRDPHHPSLGAHELSQCCTCDAGTTCR